MTRRLPAVIAVAVLGAVAVAGAAPAAADRHCDAMNDTAQQVFAALSDVAVVGTAPELCAAELETARALMANGVAEAESCGCAPMADRFSQMIAQSRNPDYECWNLHQGLRSTVLSSVGDGVSLCYGF